MPAKLEPMLCAVVQSDNWAAKPAKLKSFGGRSVGFPSVISLRMILLDYDSSPRLELKILVPKDSDTPATYFGPGLETGQRSLNYVINVNLEAGSIRTLKWKRFPATDIDLPPDAKTKAREWVLYEFAVQNPTVQGWPMPFKSRVPGAYGWFQQGHRLEGLECTMAELFGNSGVLTLAVPMKPKHPAPKDIQAVLNKPSFAYFNYGCAGWDNDMNRYTKKISQHRHQAKATGSYTAIVGYPDVTQAATALEQGVVQDVYDVHLHVQEIRSKGTVPVRFIRKDPSREDKYWAIIKFSDGFKQRFQTSLARLKREDDSVGIAFALPPSGNKPDDDLWPCKVVMRDIGFGHSGDLVLDCRRPGELDQAKDSIRHMKVNVVNTWEDGQHQNTWDNVYLAFSSQFITARPRVAAIDRVFNLARAPVTVPNVNPAVFGQRLPGCQVQLARQPSVAVAEPVAAPKLTLNLTKDQQMQIERGNLARALQRDFAQGQSLATLAQPFRPISHINFLGKELSSLQEAILDRVHANDREDLKSLLRSVPLGIFPIVGFAGSGKTDIMATVILLVIRVGPAIVCTPTHAAASNIAARALKLAHLAYDKVGVPLPVIIRAYPWRVEEQQFKARALGLSEPDSSHDPWEHAGSLVSWVQRIVLAQNLGQGPQKPALTKLMEELKTESEVQDLRNTVMSRAGWSVGHSNTFKEVAARILKVADVVCCTTHASTKDILDEWSRKTATSTFLDEARAMSMPEALVPWYNGRPLVLAGDHQEVSVLERVMRMQWPCWTSRRQSRIVNGGFDLAREIFYPELEKFEYGEQCAVKYHPVAARVESWLRQSFGSVRPSPAGSIWPAFINCAHTAVRKIDTSSVNYGQSEIVIALVESLTKVNPVRFVVVSPYRATKAYLEDLVKQRLAALSTNKDSPQYKSLSVMEVSTADSFQGKEAAVAIFLTTVTKESGHGFVKDPRRFNVGVTRHIDFVLVVGDITTMDPVNVTQETVAVSDQGTRVMTGGKKMRDAYQWFRTKERVAEVDYRAGPGAWFK
ncbi:hypothetical protein ACHAPT_013530 [Fusarium lateritium]